MTLWSYVYRSNLVLVPQISWKNWFVKLRHRVMISFCWLEKLAAHLSHLRICNITLEQLVTKNQLCKTKVSLFLHMKTSGRINVSPPPLHIWIVVVNKNVSFLYLAVLSLERKIHCVLQKNKKVIPGALILQLHYLISGLVENVIILANIRCTSFSSYETNDLLLRINFQHVHRTLGKA